MSDQQKTVRVRIPIAIDSKGQWVVNANALRKHHENIELASSYFSGQPHRLDIITADVPLPAPPAEVPGEVEATSMGERTFIDADEAIALLPEGTYVHTFRSSVPGVMIGADWERERLIAAIRENPCELAGPVATSMNHGLVVQIDGPLFVETTAPPREAEGEET